MHRRRSCQSPNLCRRRLEAWVGAQLWTVTVFYISQPRLLLHWSSPCSSLKFKLTTRLCVNSKELWTFKLKCWNTFFPSYLQSRNASLSSLSLNVRWPYTPVGAFRDEKLSHCLTCLWCPRFKSGEELLPGIKCSIRFQKVESMIFMFLYLKYLNYF